MLLQEPWATESQIWYNAAGDYIVNSIEKSTDFPGFLDSLNHYEIRLDAGGNVDAGWNLDTLTLQDQEGAQSLFTNSGIGVTLYGQAVVPEAEFEPFEMMSTQNDSSDPNGGIYDLTATNSGSLRIYMHNGTQVTWNDHYLGSSFYSKTWLDFKGQTNDNSDEYFLGGVRVRTHCTIRIQDNYDELPEASQAKTAHDNLMTLLDGTSWQLKVTGLYISSSIKTAIVIDGDTGIDANGDAILRNGMVYEIQGESFQAISTISEDILDFGFSIEYEYWEED